MKQLIFISTLFLFVSCTHTSDSETTKEVTATESKNDQESIPVDNALAFINAYVENCNKMKESIDVVEWVSSNNLTTNHFKAEVKTMIDEAYKADPELGLGADPIFDAQDYDEKGFVLESFDSKTNLVVVKGKALPEFKLTIIMVKENNTWLVDGCGMINVPVDKRMSR